MPKAVAKTVLRVGGAVGGFIVAGPLGAAIGAQLGSTLGNTIFGRTSPRPSDGQINEATPVGSRKRHYGIVHTGGQVSFRRSRDGKLAQVITLGTGEEAEILQHRINNEIVTLDGSGTVAEARYKGAIHIHTRPGSDDQTAIAQLTAAFPEWTADHRQRGCAHAAILADPVDQEDFSGVYNSQIPQYTQVRKAAKLYDPRLDSTMQIGTDGNGAPVYGVGAVRLADTATWPWNDNWALVTADYFAHPDGNGGGYENVNWANIAAEADICDQLVTVVGGGQIKRWRAWASYDLSRDERRRVLDDLRRAADGFFWQDGDGKFNLLAGRYIAPTVTLTDDHILGMTARLGPEAAQRVSGLKVLYTEADPDYAEQEASTTAVPGSSEDPNTDPQPVEAYFAPHHNQAKRVGKVIAARLGLRWNITAQLNLYGLALIGVRFVRLESARLGVAADFEIQRLPLDLASMASEVQLVEIEPGDWDFDAATEEGTPPVTAGAAAAPAAPSAPTGLALSAVQIALGETNGVAIAATWDDPGRLGLNYAAQYRPSAGGDWVAMTVDQANRTARSGAVDSGVEYEVQVRAFTIGLWSSAWSASATITPVASNVLQPPIELAAAAGGSAGEADVSWRNPFGASFDHVKIFESTTDDIGTASQIGTDFPGALGALNAQTFTGLSAGTHYFWARSFDAAANPSAAAGSVSAVVT